VTTVALTGSADRWRGAEETFVVPSHETPRIQETHITLGHALCALVEDLVVEDPHPRTETARKR